MPQKHDIRQVRELLKRRQTSRQRIAKAERHEQRIRLHSSLNLDDAQNNCKAAIREFLRWVEDTLRKPEKFEMFCHLMRFPVSTVPLTSEIYGALEKVYDGRNPVYHFDFAAPEFQQDYQDYRREKNLTEFFKQKTWGRVKEHINSLVVVDLPAEQEGQNPEPYAYFLDITAVHDYEWNGERFKWICWKDDDRLIWMDEMSYQVFELKDDGTGIDVTLQLLDVNHNLEYTPVFFTWNDPVNEHETDIKQSPISPFLGELDKLLFKEVSKNHLDLYASYPIYWAFEQDCEYRHEETGEYCDRGWIRDSLNEFVIARDVNGTGSLKACPACSERRFIGAGTVAWVPPPDPENGIGDTRNPVGIVSIDTASLEYNRDEVERLKKAIYDGATGHGGSVMNDQAANETQIAAIVDAKKAALFNLKKNLEKLQKNVEETICRLRYGDVFKGATINYGTEFHLLTPADARKQYEEAKKNGADAATLDNLQDEYIATRYRHDPLKLQRERILCNLDPFRHRSVSEVAGLYQAGIIPADEYYLKFNFSTLIARFEREQTNLILFGEALEFDTKIERIRQVLKQYATESTTERRPESGEGDD